MPLFRRQSEKGRKRQQRQEFLAQQDPEPRFDLSDCELQEVPSGVYAICRVLQKEALFLNGNWLSTLNGGGKIADLQNLRILDLHNNELKVLPDEIGCLEKLQILNLENNRLRMLPDVFENFRSLQTLNVKKNKLKQLPASVCDLPSLRLLDISSNEITELPQRLAYIRTLETLQLDADVFQYPPSSVCKKGTEAIMKFLCSENGLEYEPPSKFLLEALDPPRGIQSSQSDNSIKTKAFEEEARLMESVNQYQNHMQKKREEASTLQQQLLEEARLQDQLAALACRNKKDLLETITQDQARMDHHLSQLSSLKEEERKRFVNILNEVEHSADKLLSQMLDVTEKARKTEALLDEMEKERMHADSWFKVQTEELANLRKQEVLEGMNQILEEYRLFEQQRQVSESERDSRNQHALMLEDEISNSQVASMISHRAAGQRVLLDTLAQQEELQKQAVEALMLARDAKHSRLGSQIALVEMELAQLTVVEMGKKALQLDTQMNVLAEKRIALSGLLSQLLEEQMRRQKELHLRLGEMEQLREDSQLDYWLVQYQRLLDKKPQALIDKESQLEISVKQILIRAEADDYIPLFARHRITIETLMQLTDADLKQMGVHELGLRKAILKAVFMERDGSLKLTQKEKEISLLPRQLPDGLPAVSLHPAARASSADERLSPSAPLSSLFAGSTAKQSPLTIRGINTECVVCMDRMSEVIFLPCGHVCTCPTCSGPLRDCPMCRSPVIQKIKLNISAPVSI